MRAEVQRTARAGASEAQRTRAGVQGKDHQGTIDLEGAKLKKVEKKKKFGVEVAVRTGKTHTLFADSDADAQAWLDGLKAAQVIFFFVFCFCLWFFCFCMCLLVLLGCFVDLFVSFCFPFFFVSNTRHLCLSFSLFLNRCVFSLKNSLVAETRRARK